ncbi:ZP domain-containing protein-like [Montipora capricornis]|uniref:ZP domain-containing protein-like n=1 Tax=Montipora capricornis TaxID=246305 RepID=UPI0035F11816
MAYHYRLLTFLGVISLFVLSVTSQGVCPRKWQLINGSCYKVSSTSGNWNAAKSACEAIGSRLAMLKTHAEQQAVWSKVGKHVWIGLHRNPKNSPQWLWVDGSQVTDTNWHSGEPNNYGGNEGCGVMHSSSYPAPGTWYDAPCSSTLPYFCEANANCQRLSLGSGVRVAPSHCLSSNQRYGSTCSFSCARGYRLSGPTSTQCMKLGVWSRDVRTVSCKDINECLETKNGGCSHKCVNSPGVYKCGCPDPELTLSSDNKTCHAPGVDVRCNSKNMTIVIPKFLLRGIDREHLRLLDTRCKATETSAHFVLSTPLTGCNTTRKNTPSNIVYSNVVLEIPVVDGNVVTRVRELEIEFSCVFSRGGIAFAVGWKPNNRKLMFSDEGKGNFTMSLNMFPDKRFVRSYMKDDFPVAVRLRKLLFFEVSVTSSDKQLSIKADRCFATPSQDQNNPLKYEFIAKGCPNDSTVKFHPAHSLSAQRFSLEAFKFIADHPFVFIHCHVILCNATDPSSKCAKKCQSRVRQTREVSDHMIDDVHHLAQGPLHLSRKRREEKADKAANKSGSNPALLMTLLLMCAACLVGIALMALKKLPDKPARYTVLATEDQE